MIQRQALLVAFSASLLLFQNCSPASFTQSAQQAAATGIVCDGVASSTDCNPATSKVTGEIYALSSDERAAHGADGVDTYFNFGDKIPATVLMDQIFIPTRLFNSGFPASGDSGPSLLKNGDGVMLMEYFALRLKTSLSLTANQGAGLYQIALLSDDGSRLTRLDTGEVVVDNNTTHSTEMGCGNTISLAQGQSVPLQIDYYQGPAEEIALTLMWRKVDPSASLSDPLCGSSGNNVYFGPNFDDQTSAYGFGQLVSRGWSAVPSANLSHLGN